MEMALKMGAFEALDMQDLMGIDGGRNWVATIAGTVAGGAGIVGGVCLLLTPEPTGLTKVGGWSAITGGVASIVWAWS